MATMTGILGGSGPGKMSGRAQLRSLDKEKAGELLNRLGDDLNNRTGVVRLLHTSKTDTEMKFKTAGGFKQMFLNGGKLERSGAVIRDLLANAGAPQEQLDAFDGYLRTRGHSGVQTERVQQEIAKLKDSILKAVVAASEREALVAAEELMPKAEVADTESEALEAYGMKVSTDPQAKVAQGGFGKILSFEHEGQPMVLKQPIRKGGGWDLQLQDSRGVLLRPNDTQLSPPKGVSLSRKGIAVAARVKSDIPEAIAPSVFVIKETQSNKQERFHAVGGGRQLKIWARQQPGNAELKVVSMVMPMAAGVQPLAFVKGTKVNIDSSDLKPMARSGLKGLQNFSKHGFIHGDIKPENMIWDTKTQTLRVIDLDGMLKISKKWNWVPNNTGTSTELYLHPINQNPKSGVGVGRDLFAFGLTMLETSVYAEGDKEKIKGFITLQKYLTQGEGRGDAATEDGRQKIFSRLDQESQAYPPDSVQHFALQAIKTSIEYEGKRLQDDVRSYARWREEDASHPLNLLAQHPAVQEKHPPVN